MDIRQSITSNHICIMLMDEGACIGGLDADLMGDYWYLSRLIVKPNGRGKGYGRKMIEVLKENCDGIRIVVYPGGYDLAQKDIESFYKHMGFLETDDGFIWSDVK